MGPRRKNGPAGLINVALETLVKGSFELPGYSTLDEMAALAREEVSSSAFATVASRIGPAGAARLEETLRTGGPGTKRPAARQANHLDGGSCD